MVHSHPQEIKDINPLSFTNPHKLHTTRVLLPQSSIFIQTAHPTALPNTHKMAFLAAIFCCDTAPAAPTTSRRTSTSSESSESICSSSSDSSSESAWQYETSILRTPSSPKKNPTLRIITKQPRRSERPAYPASPSTSASSSPLTTTQPKRVAGLVYPGISTSMSALPSSTVITTLPKRVVGPVYYPRWSGDKQGMKLQVLPIIAEVEEEE
jgi:hypothetical protein